MSWEEEIEQEERIADRAAHREDMHDAYSHLEEELVNEVIWLYEKNFGGAELDDSGFQSEFEECFEGIWKSQVEFAENLADGLGMVSEGAAANYFDYAKFADDLFMSDYTSYDLSNGLIAVWRSI